MSNKVLKAGIGYTIGNILVRGIGFLSIPIFTRLMSTADYGLYNTYAAYEAIFYIVVGMALNSCVKSANLEYREKFDEFMASIVMLVLASAGAWLVILNVIFPFLPNAIWEYNRIILNLLVLHSCASALLVIYNAAVSVKYQYKDYLKISLLNSFGGVAVSVLLICFVFKNQAYMGRIAGVVTSVLITAILILFYFIKKAKPIVSFKYYSFALKYSFPVIPHGIAQVLLAQFDRIMIKSIIGASEAGIYSFTGNISSIMKVITASIETAWGPWFFEQYNLGHKKEIKQVTKTIISGFTLFTCGVMLCAPEVLKLMAPATYWDGIRLVVPMALDVFCTFAYTLYVQVEYYFKKTHYLMIGTLGAAIINVILNAIMIPRYGYVAAAYTTLFSYVCYFMFHYIISRRIAKTDVIGIDSIIISSILNICVAVIATVFSGNFFIRWGTAFVLTIFYMIKLLPDIRKYIMNKSKR